MRHTSSHSDVSSSSGANTRPYVYSAEVEVDPAPAPCSWGGRGGSTTLGVLTWRWDLAFLLGDTGGCDPVEVAAPGVRAAHSFPVQFEHLRGLN
jgi:hypothetical protein